MNREFIDILQDLGPVTAYAYAVEKGYTGTEEEFEELMASYATVAQQAIAARDDAIDAKDAAETARGGAEAAQEAAEGVLEDVQEAGEAIVEDVQEAGADAIEEIQQTLDSYAHVDGYYEEMTVGNAEQLVATVGVNDNTPYLFRTTGGSADVGDRKTMELVGGTVAWNQLISNGNFANDSTTGWSGSGSLGASTYHSLSASNGVMTLTATAKSNRMWGVKTSVVLTAGHKYALIGGYQRIRGGSDVDFNTMNILGLSETAETLAALSTPSAGKYRLDKIFTPTANATALAIRTSGVVQPSANTQMFSVWNVQLIDITLMFGNEVASYIQTLETATAGAGIAWIRSIFPKDYYTYNAGTLMSVRTSAHKMVGFNAYNNVSGEAKLVGGMEYQITGTYTALSYSTGETITPDEDGYFTPSSDGVLAVTGGDATTTCVHLVWDGERDDEWEEYTEHSYPLDSDLELRGIPKIDSDGKLYYDGDIYESDGTVHRNYWRIAFDGTENIVTVGTASSGIKYAEVRVDVGGKDNLNGIGNKWMKVSTEPTESGCFRTNGTRIYIYDDSITDKASAQAIIAGAEIVYEKLTKTTETAEPFTSPEAVDDFGTEQFVDERYVPLPVGHNSVYQANLRAKLEMAPDSPSGDGDYLVRQSGGTNTYVPYIVPTAGNVNYSDSEDYDEGTIGEAISTLKSAIDNLDISPNLVYDDAEQLINYKYETPYHYETASRSIDRQGQIITIDGPGLTSGYEVIKISGDVERAASSSTVKAWTAVVGLSAGHTYQVRVKRLSGTVSQGTDYSVPSCSIYASGTSSTAGTGGHISPDEFVRTIDVTEDDLFTLGLYIPVSTTFSKCVLLVTLQDLTAAKYAHFSSLDTKINALHGLVNYGYCDSEVAYMATGGTNEGTSVAVTRLGTHYVFNYSVASNSYAKRVRISGEPMLRRSGGSTYKSWVGNLQLTQGRTYLARLVRTSGTGTYGEDLYYLPRLVVYESAGEATIATETLRDEPTGIEEITFTAPAGPVSFAVYIHSNAVLTNFACDITLEVYTEDSDMASYYLSELEDTVAKVRSETTAPALVFPWTTDMHRYSSNASGQTFGAMIQNMKAFAKDVPCDFVLDTGDMTDGNTVQATTFARAYDSAKLFREIGVPHIWAMGNHDTNYAVSGYPYIFSLAQCYQAYYPGTKGVYNANENGTDFYVDFDTVNTRVISLNANNRSTVVEYGYGSSTAAWLADALDTDKNVILVVHQSPLKTQVYNQTSSSGSSAIVSAINDFISGGGNLIMLSGHSHRDVAYILPWLSIMSDCARYTALAEGYDDETSSMSGYIETVYKNARVQNTASEDLWTVCVYKPDSNELSLIRFGAGADRYFHVTHIAPTTLTSKLTDVTWSSSNTAVATVSDGVVTGVATGTCAIIAKDATGNYECWIVDVI